MKKFLRTSLILGTVLVLHCGNDDNASSGAGMYQKYGEENSKHLIESFADNTAMATYSTLNEKATALKTAVEALANSVNDSNVTSARNAWKAAREYWESSEGFLFGPVDNLGIDPSVDSWPLDKTELDAVISGGNNCGSVNTSIT